MRDAARAVEEIAALVQSGSHYQARVRLDAYVAAQTAALRAALERLAGSYKGHYDKCSSCGEFWGGQHAPTCLVGRLRALLADAEGRRVAEQWRAEREFIAAYRDVKVALADNQMQGEVFRLGRIADAKWAAVERSRRA